MVHLLTNLANQSLTSKTELNRPVRFGLAAAESNAQTAVKPGVNLSDTRANGRNRVSRSTDGSYSKAGSRQTQVEQRLPRFTDWMESYRHAAPAINTTMAVLGTTGNGLVRLDAATGAFTRSLGARSFYGVVNNAMDGYIEKSPTLTRFLKEHPILSGIPLVVGMSALCSFAGDGLKTVMTTVYDWAIRPPLAYLINRFGVDMAAYKSACSTSAWLKSAVDIMENPRFRNIVGLGSLAVVGLMAASTYNRSYGQNSNNA